MTDEKEAIEVCMEGLIAANASFYEDDTDNSDETGSIQQVEERLLSFYRQSLDHPHSHRSSLEKHPQEQLPIHAPHAYPCPSTYKSLPSDPAMWPQRPVMLRPSPRTTTKIRGIRLANSREYQHFKGFCAGCILPINTGRELPGQSLVIDFESKHFCGTLLMRILGAPPASDNPESDFSYFHGKKRRFQAIVKGKFKSPLKMSECVTGQLFDRPAGNLPARWIVTSFIKFVSTLAPQLEATIDGDQPRFLTPLVATAHTVLVKPTTNDEEQVPTTTTCSDGKDDDALYNYQVYAGAVDIEDNVEEPSAEDSTSVMQQVPKATKDSGSVGKRQKARKKAFNQLFAKRAQEPCFQLDTEYTFEFYQHLLLFGDSLAVDMGRVIGSVDLSPVTDGQPIKFMSAHKDSDTGELDVLWSFDIWHESLYALAQAAEQDEESE